jgi:predicted PurR-regulated permease PerM
VDNKLFSPIWIKVGLILFTLYIISQVTSIYLPITLSVVLAFILNPLVNLISQIRLKPVNFRISRGPAILLSFAVSGSIIGLMAAFILVPFIEEFNSLLINLPLLTEKVKKLTLILATQTHTNQVPESVRGVVDQTLSSAASFSVDMAKRLLNAVISFATQIIELIVVPVLAFYLLKDWQLLRESFISLVPQGMQGTVREVISEMALVVSGYIRGQVFVSLIVGLIVFCGMYFFNIEYPLVLGLLAGITEAIPIIGPFIGAAPAVLLAYLLSPALAIKVILFYVFVQQIENHIIVPKVMGHSIDLHPIAIIISLLVGGQLFGLVGMMIAVPAAALLKVMAKHLWYYGER